MQPHFTVERAALVHELNLIIGAVERKTTIPILGNVRMEARDGSLQLTATDLELAVTSQFATETKAAGAATIGAKRLLAYVTLLPDGPIEMKFTPNDWASITAGRSKTRIAGMAAESFPEIPQAAPNAIAIPAAHLLRQIKQTAYAISQEESRFTLNGALLEIGEDRVRMVATDGHRMAVADAPGIPRAPSALDAGGQKVILPRRAMAELAKLAAGVETICFSSDENHFFFQVGSRLLVARKMTGNFPDYQRVVPKELPLSAIVGAAELRGALSRAKIMADERSSAIKLSLRPGEACVASAVSETGEAQESIAAEYDGAPVEVGLNAKYVLDFLGATDETRVVIGLKDAGSAVRFAPADDASCYCVVMPLRL